MKITFEVPDTTRAAFLNIVFSHDDEMMLSGIAADSEEIERHDVIKFREHMERIMDEICDCNNESNAQ